MATRQLPGGRQLGDSRPFAAGSCLPVVSSVNQLLQPSSSTPEMSLLPSLSLLPRAFRRLPPLPVLKQPSSDAPWLQPRQAAQMAWLTPKPSVGCCLTHLLPVQFHLLAESLLLRSPTMPTSTSACHMLKAKSGDGPSSSQAALPPPPRPPSHHSVLLRGTSPSRAQTVPGAWNSQRSAQ